MTDESNHWLSDAIRTHGLPSVLVCVFVVGLWRAGVYISTEVIQPMLQTHLEFVKESTDLMRQMQENGRESLIRIEKNTDEILESVRGEK